MPIYEFLCSNRHLSEELCAMGTSEVLCRCGERADRRPSRFSFTNTPTGSGREVRQQFRLFQEATQELDYHHTRAEADLERSLPTPDLWGQAKERALQIQHAGEAPPSVPLE